MSDDLATVAAERAATNSEEYDARGVTREAWTCVCNFSQRDAKDYVWRLAEAGIPALVRRDGNDKKKWHVAIQGGLRYNPMALMVSWAPDMVHAPVCDPAATGQHVWKERDEVSG